MKYLTKQTFLTLCLLSALALLLSVRSQQAEPGAVTVSANLKYLNNMFGLMFPITMQNLIQNQTIPIGYSTTKFGYSVKIDNLHVDNINFNKKEIKFVEGTNKTRLYVDGLDLNITINGAIYALWIIPIHTASLNVTNVTLQIDLESNNTDDLNFQIQDALFLDVKDVQFNIKASWMQWLVNIFHSKIMSAVKEALPVAKATIQTGIDGFNANLRNRNYSAFMFDILGPQFPLNLTFTHAPVLDAATNVITLNLDGTFFDRQFKTNHVASRNTVYPQRV
jgi:hypothetical protein